MAGETVGAVKAKGVETLRVQEERVVQKDGIFGGSVLSWLHVGNQVIVELESGSSHTIVDDGHIDLLGGSVDIESGFEIIRKGS